MSSRRVTLTALIAVLAATLLVVGFVEPLLVPQAYAKDPVVRLLCPKQAPDDDGLRNPGCGPDRIK